VGVEGVATAPEVLHDVVAAVLLRGHARHIAAADTSYRAGDPGDAMFVLLRGAVVSRVTSPAGDVVDLGLAALGDAFGYFELVDPRPRREDAVALRDSEVLVLPAVAAVRAMRSSPETLLGLAGDHVGSRRLAGPSRATAGHRPPSEPEHHAADTGRPRPDRRPPRRPPRHHRPSGPRGVRRRSLSASGTHLLGATD